MRFTLLRSLLLAMLLILSQGFTLEHAGEHVSLDDDPACELCVHLHKLGAAVLPSPPSFAAASSGRYFGIPAEVVARFVTPPRRFPIRGPPETSL